MFALVNVFYVYVYDYIWYVDIWFSTKIEEKNISIYLKWFEGLPNAIPFHNDKIHFDCVKCSAIFLSKKNNIHIRSMCHGCLIFQVVHTYLCFSFVVHLLMKIWWHIQSLYPFILISVSNFGLIAIENTECRW